MADVDPFDFENPEFENPETPPEAIEAPYLTAERVDAPVNYLMDEYDDELDEEFIEPPEAAEPGGYVPHPAEINESGGGQISMQDLPEIAPFHQVEKEPEILEKEAGTPDGHETILLTHLLSYGKSGRTEFKWKLFLSEASKGRLALAGELTVGHKLIVPVDYDANHSNARRYMARKGWLVGEHYALFRHLMPSGDSYIGIAFLKHPGEQNTEASL